MPRNFKRSTRSIVASIVGTPWMILESTLHQMIGFLELRHAGGLQSRDQVEQLLERSDHGRGVCRAADLNFNPQDDEDFEGPVVVDGGIAVLPMTGVLAPRLSWMEQVSGGTSTELFSRWYQEALADARVNAILCRIDSPGGSATGNEELSTMIRQARGRKHAVAVAQGTIASAAYYNGGAFKELYASPSTQVGSVGCFMIHGESSIADKDAGYTFTVVKAGEFKAAGNDVEPLSPQTKGVLQERIDAFYNQFVAAVAANRGVSVSQVEAQFGQGKVMLAEAARGAGMIDGVRTFDEVLIDLQSRFKSTGSSARGRSGGTSTRAEAKEGQQMNRIKSALVKMGLCTAEDDDAIVQKMAKSFCKAKGIEMPADEDTLLAILEGKVAAAAVTTTTQPATTQPATTLPTATQPNAAVDLNQARLEERARVANIRASGELLQLDDATIQAAIDSGKNLDAVMTEWRTSQSATQTPVQKIAAASQKAEKLEAAAVESMSVRLGLTGAKLSPESRDLQYASMLEMGKVMLIDRGIRTVGMVDEDIAKLMLGSQQFGDLVVIRSDAGAGYQRPGDFPGIMSALAGKILDEAEALGNSTFREWTGKLPSVPDFKPKTIHSVGEFGELPAHEDAEPFDESAVSEEAAWIAIDEYGDNWSLTPRMILNDDLDALSDAMMGKQDAHDMTLERLCVNLLTGNVNAQDGNPLFGTTRTAADGTTTQANEIASGSGGAPSTTHLANMRKLARKIYGIGGKQKLNQTLERLLIPEDLETATEQLLDPSLVVVPTAETGAQNFRGRCKWTVVPLLGEASATQWYATTTSRRRAIVHTFLRGFEKMRVTSYFDPKTGCRVWNFLGRMAAAVRTWRTMLRNYGS